MTLESDSRAWNKADLFTLIVELYWALNKDRIRLTPRATAKKLERFYNQVDKLTGVETKTGRAKINGANGAHTTSTRRPPMPPDVAADVAEAEEVGDQERFDATRVEARERAKREAEQKARGRALPPGKSG